MASCVSVLAHTAYGPNRSVASSRYPRTVDSVESTLRDTRGGVPEVGPGERPGQPVAKPVLASEVLGAPVHPALLVLPVQRRLAGVGDRRHRNSSAP